MIGFPSPAKSKYWKVLSPGRRRATQKLAELLALEDGWRFGEGAAIERDVGVRAVEFIAIADSNHFRIQLFPGAAGEMMVNAFQIGGASLELILETDGLVTLTVEKDGKEVQPAICVTDEDAIRALNNFQLWSTYVYSTPASGIPKEGDLHLWHSAMPRGASTEPMRKSEFQSSRNYVAPGQPAASVNTSADTITTGASRQWCGLSTSNASMALM